MVGKKISTKVKKQGFEKKNDDVCGESVSITHYWHQKFLANRKIIIEHSYVPVFSSSVEDLTKENIWDDERTRSFRTGFCTSNAQVEKIQKKI